MGSHGLSRNRRTGLLAAWLAASCLLVFAAPAAAGTLSLDSYRVGDAADDPAGTEVYLVAPNEPGADQLIIVTSVPIALADGYSTMGPDTKIAGTCSDSYIYNASSQIRTCGLYPSSAFKVIGSPRADTIKVHCRIDPCSRQIQVVAGDGDDQILADSGPATSISLDGGSGNDLLSVGQGALGGDLFGGEGNDTINTNVPAYAEHQVFRISCGPGVDHVDAAARDVIDADCSEPTVREKVATVYDCNNHLDDDGDGRVDYPADPGCVFPTDTSEADPPPCSNGIDDEGDGKIDFPEDPDCESAAGGSEGKSTCPPGLPAGTRPVSNSPKKDVRLRQAGGYYKIGNAAWNGTMFWCTNGDELNVVSAEGSFDTDTGQASFWGASAKALAAGAFGFAPVSATLKWRAYPDAFSEKHTSVSTTGGLLPIWTIKVETGELQECVDPLGLLFIGGKWVKKLAELGPVAKLIKKIPNQKAFLKLSAAGRKKALGKILDGYEATWKKALAELDKGYDTKRKLLKSKLTQQYKSRGLKADETATYNALAGVPSKKFPRKKAGDKLTSAQSQRLAAQVAKETVEPARAKAKSRLKKEINAIRGAISSLALSGSPDVCVTIWEPVFTVVTSASGDSVGLQYFASEGNSGAERTFNIAVKKVA